MAAREPLLGANIVTLSICYQHLAARFNRVLEPMALNMTQMSLLTHMAHRPDDYRETITGLSQLMEMNQPMVTKAIKAMHINNLVDKTPGENDARVSYISLTLLGRKRLSDAQQACLPLINEAFADLSEKELGQLLHLLSKIRNSLN